MASLDQLRQLTGHLHNLSRLSPDRTRELAEAHPNLPADYWAFLSDIGFGDLRELQIYSGPVAASSIYGSRDIELAPFALFGDDFQGHTFGFDTRRSSGLVVELDPRGEARELHQSFSDLIATYLAKPT